MTDFECRQPVPVDFSKKSWRSSVEQVIASTFFFNKGECINVKVARVNFSREQIVENIAVVVPALMGKLPGRGKHVVTINIKTASSISIPIFHKALEDGAVKLVEQEA